MDDGIISGSGISVDLTDVIQFLEWNNELLDSINNNFQLLLFMMLVIAFLLGYLVGERLSK